MDFIATPFARAKYTWWATQKTKWIWGKDIEIGCCMLPVLGASKNAAEYLYQRRLEHGEVYKKVMEKKNVRWIFCEAFAATEIENHKYFTGGMITNQYIKPPYKKFNLDTIKKHQYNSPYHPIKNQEESLHIITL